MYKILLMILFCWGITLDAGVYAFRISPAGKNTAYFVIEFFEFDIGLDAKLNKLIEYLDKSSKDIQSFQAGGEITINGSSVGYSCNSFMTKAGSFMQGWSASGRGGVPDNQTDYDSLLTGELSASGDHVVFSCNYSHKPSGYSLAGTFSVPLNKIFIAGGQFAESGKQGDEGGSPPPEARR